MTETLSSKRQNIGWTGAGLQSKATIVYPEEAVKEFIKKEGRLIDLWIKGCMNHEEFWEARRKLAGEQLSK